MYLVIVRLSKREGEKQRSKNTETEMEKLKKEHIRFQLNLLSIKPTERGYF